MKKNTKNINGHYKHLNIGLIKILIGIIIFICVGFLYSCSSVRDEDEVFNELGQTFHQDYAVYTTSSGEGFIFDIKNEGYKIGVNSFMMLGSDVIYTEDTYYHPDFIEVVNQMKNDIILASEIAGRGYFIHLSNPNNENNYLFEAVNGEVIKDYLLYGDGSSTLE